MKKKINMPSFLLDSNSLWNPLINSFPSKSIKWHDEYHVFKPTIKVGLYHKSKERMISIDVLKQYGAKEISPLKDEVLFREGEEALNYFQVVSGSIKMITNSSEGQEFIQGIFKADDSFGEPPLFCSFPYPSTARALEDSVIIKLSKEKFFLLLKENFEIHLHLDQILCQRLKYKSMILSEISFYDPEHRIMSLLKYLKDDSTRSAVHKHEMIRANHTYVVPFTRQQIADMSGLRVETVIRTVKKMEGEGKLQLIDKKITL
jgi:CRP/FNR family transcriptional regulator, cyclic AMP receptor protein